MLKALRRAYSISRTSWECEFGTTYYIISVLRYLCALSLEFKTRILLLPRVIKIRNYYGFDKHPQLFQALCIQCLLLLWMFMATIYFHIVNPLFSKITIWYCMNLVQRHKAGKWRIIVNIISNFCSYMYIRCI